jgi:hypothetical protein
VANYNFPGSSNEDLPFKKGDLITIIQPTRVRLKHYMVFIATFNNISVISWRSVLLVEEIRVPGENH